MLTDVSMNAAVVTATDSRTYADDSSGTRLVELLNEFGAEVVEHLIVSDDFEVLRNTLFSLTEREEINLILTTGGTGLAERDNTPEATRSIISKEVPGISEAIRASSLKHTRTAMLSRGVTGIRNSTLIINLPGSEKAVVECFEVIRSVLQHAVNQISGNTLH